MRRHIELRTTFTDGTASHTVNIRYLVVNAPSAYNILLGRPALNRTRAVAKKLLDDGHIREIQYPEWLANVVLVKKTNGKWRMCVDFTYLNKACPKDSYPLPKYRRLGGQHIRLQAS